MAGLHTLQAAQAGSLAQRTYKPLLRPGRHKTIGFAQRSQALIVANGNPLQLHSLQDVVLRAAISPTTGSQHAF